jgi:hypothetical protein
MAYVARVPVVVGDDPAQDCCAERGGDHWPCGTQTDARRCTGQVRGVWCGLLFAITHWHTTLLSSLPFLPQLLSLRPAEVWRGFVRSLAQPALFPRAPPDSLRFVCCSFCARACLAMRLGTCVPSLRPAPKGTLSLLFARVRTQLLCKCLSAGMGGCLDACICVVVAVVILIVGYQSHIHSKKGYGRGLELCTQWNGCCVCMHVQLWIRLAKPFCRPSPTTCSPSGQQS